MGAALPKTIEARHRLSRRIAGLRGKCAAVLRSSAEHQVPGAGTPWHIWAGQWYGADDHLKVGAAQTTAFDFRSRIVPAQRIVGFDLRIVVAGPALKASVQ